MLPTNFASVKPESSSKSQNSPSVSKNVTHALTKNPAQCLAA